MFIGRSKELAELDRLYHSDNFELVVMYGRRRVGKTALINSFIRRAVKPSPSGGGYKVPRALRESKIKNHENPLRLQV